jgi:hypothetical protein
MVEMRPFYFRDLKKICEKMLVFKTFLSLFEI